VIAKAISKATSRRGRPELELVGHPSAAGRVEERESDDRQIRQRSVSVMQDRALLGSFT
jgi:hypothetical protein